MKVMTQSVNFVVCDGKFFKKVGEDEKLGTMYRQVELYLPASTGCFKEELIVTAERWLDELEKGRRTPRWAIGSTGSLMTARYAFRQDGELVSKLSLEGGM